MANRLRQSQSTTDKNAAILRELLKRPENRVCADCHVATHPRWASWSLGVFICIRCSGIHRGMGTHISRVKSADLDSWTDEQTQNMVKWGNRRANKYWEASLPASHIPSDSKMENFIRTKYSSKRWVLSSSPPEDPSILDDISDNPEEESVPLAIVKQNLEQKSVPQPSQTRPPQQSRPQNLLGNDTPPPSRGTPDRTDSPSPKPSRPRTDRVSNQSLLGLDFTSPVRTRFNSTETTSSAATAPAAAAAAPVATSRNDLKNSILRLYAPKPAPSAPVTPAVSTPPVQSTQSALGDLNSAFGGLSFSTTAATSSSTGFTSPPITSPPLSNSAFSPSPPSTSGTTGNGFPGFGGHTAGKLSFGQTANAPPPPKPTQPTTFTVPLKKTSPPVTSPASTSPQLPKTSKYTPKNVVPELPHSNWAPTFNLSKSTASTTTTSAPPPPPKSNQTGIQLLSTLTPITSSNSVPTVTSSQPATAPSSSFANPWASGGTNAGGGLAGFGSDPWSTHTTSTKPAQTASNDIFNGFQSAPATKPVTTSVGDWGSSASVIPASSNFPSSGSSSTSAAKATTSSSAFGDWGSTITPATTSNFSSSGFGDWGKDTGVANGNAKRISKDNKVDSDDFGLFETADVWK